MTADHQRRSAGWPRLLLSDWPETRDPLHMWTQIIGKVRMAHEPLVNHWWQATLYVSPRGLTTSAVPHASGAFDVELDLVDHQVRIRPSDSGGRAVPLTAKPVAQIYAE